MIDVGPIPCSPDTDGEHRLPDRPGHGHDHVRAPGGTGLEIGSYAHRAILHDPDDIPSIEESALTPTEFPFTQEDFDLQMEQALELMPAILGDESVGIKYAINGLLSLTPDGMPMLGETPEVQQLWSAAAVWVKEGPASGSSSPSGWCTATPHIDPHSSDIARF